MGTNRQINGMKQNPEIGSNTYGNNKNNQGIEGNANSAEVTD